MRRFNENRSLLDSVILLCVFLMLVFISYRFGQWMNIHQTTGSNLSQIETEQIHFDSELWIETLSWTPRLSIYHNILTEEECDHIVLLAGRDIENKPSGILSLEGGFLSDSSFKEDAVLEKLTKTLAEWTQIPKENGEDYYLWKFKVGDSYPNHRDTIKKPEHLQEAGERLASVYVYLSTPGGGELQFPDAVPPVTITPKKGSAVLLWNLRPNGEDDEFTTHNILPVTEGLKWTLTKWLRQKRFQKENEQ